MTVNQRTIFDISMVLMGCRSRINDQILCETLRHTYWTISLSSCQYHRCRRAQIHISANKDNIKIKTDTKKNWNFKNIFSFRFISYEISQEIPHDDAIIGVVSHVLAALLLVLRLLDCSFFSFLPRLLQWRAVMYYVPADLLLSRPFSTDWSLSYKLTCKLTDSSWIRLCKVYILSDTLT